MAPPYGLTRASPHQACYSEDFRAQPYHESGVDAWTLPKRKITIQVPRDMPRRWLWFIAVYGEHRSDGATDWFARITLTGKLGGVTVYTEKFDYGDRGDRLPDNPGFLISPLWADPNYSVYDGLPTAQMSRVLMYGSDWVNRYPICPYQLMLSVDAFELELTDFANASGRHPVSHLIWGLGVLSQTESL